MNSQGNLSSRGSMLRSSPVLIVEKSEAGSKKGRWNWRDWREENLEMSLLESKFREQIEKREERQWRTCCGQEKGGAKHVPPKRSNTITNSFPFLYLANPSFSMGLCPIVLLQPIVLLRPIGLLVFFTYYEWVQLQL